MDGAEACGSTLAREFLMRIVILGGAGMMGQGIVRDLLSDLAIVPIEEISVPDASTERLAALRTTFVDTSRLSTSVIDVGDGRALAGALADFDLCINSIPTLAGHQMRIFEACLTARVPYLDLGGLGVVTVKQLECRERFRSAGVTAVLGNGSDPGMSNVICRAVADDLDEIDKINLYWAAELVGPESPVLVPPYSISTVLAEYAHPSTQFLDGRHVSCPPLTGREVLDLPEPWGRCEFMYTAHSEPLTVPLAEGIREKGIKEFTWKLHLPHREHEAWIGLIKAGFGDFDDPVPIGGATVKPLDVLNAVVFRNIERNKDRLPAQDSHEIHFAIGRGRRGGRPATARCEVIIGPDPMYDGYKDAGTSMNASIAAQLMLAHPLRPGVFAPEEYFNVNAYFRELERRRFRIKREVRLDG
jgi:saccharopine dehydrogenase-like NADP-dependent oxidoreductase